MTISNKTVKNNIIVDLLDIDKAALKEKPIFLIKPLPIKTTVLKFAFDHIYYDWNNQLYNKFGQLQKLSEKDLIECNAFNLEDRKQINHDSALTRIRIEIKKRLRND